MTDSGLSEGFSGGVGVTWAFIRKDSSNLDDSWLSEFNMAESSSYQTLAMDQTIGRSMATSTEDSAEKTPAVEELRGKVPSPLSDYDMRKLVTIIECHRSVGVRDTPVVPGSASGRCSRSPRRHALCYRRSCIRCRGRRHRSIRQRRRHPHITENITDVILGLENLCNAIKECTRV